MTVTSWIGRERSSILLMERKVVMEVLVMAGGKLHIDRPQQEDCWVFDSGSLEIKVLTIF